MKRKLRNNKKGFSLIEMIIVIAILGIMVSIVSSMLSYIKAGRTKQSAARLDARISKMQTDTMTKKDSYYLYVYMTPAGANMITVKKNSATDKGFTSWSELDSYISGHKGDVTFLGGARITTQISGKKPDGSTDSREIPNSNMLKIGYNKGTGNFRVSTYNGKEPADPAHPNTIFFYDTITFTGNDNYKVHLVKDTGKHYIED